MGSTGLAAPDGLDSDVDLDLEQLGWLTTGDPGPFPPLPAEQDGCRAHCQAHCPPASCSRATQEPVGWATPGVPQPPRASGVMSGLAAALDAVEGHGALSGSRSDTSAILRLAERARGLALRELAEMDAVGGPLIDGAARTTTASWLRDELKLTDSAARGAVRLGRDLRDELPELGTLLRNGQITVEHAAAVLDGVRGLSPDMVADAAAGLCALAQAADPTDIRQRLRAMATDIDDRLAARAERRARERMGLRLAEVGAQTVVDGTLAGDVGATVRLAMSLATEAARTAGDKRGRAARQADVLHQWAADYLTRQQGPGDSLADDAHSVRTHLHITCTLEQLAAVATPGKEQPDLGELLQDDQTGRPRSTPAIIGDQCPLSRAALRRLACDATLDLVVSPTPGTHTRGSAEGRPSELLTDPLYVGRSSRTVSGVQFRALIVRDRRCVVRGCHRPPAQCAAHHVQHWADGGRSDLDNLALLCHQHHHDHHDRGQDLPHQDGRRWLTRSGWAHDPP